MDHALAKEQQETTTPAAISGRVKPVLFLLFFCSGFCSLLYQVVWIRMAFAHFGVITPVLSVVLSVFMLGLGLGSWLGGRWVELWSSRLKISPAYFYGGAELVIAVGAFVVPRLFQFGEDYLLGAGEASSTGYLLISAIFIVIAILPWCTMMGATFPLMMSFVRQTDPANQESFSFLYLANVMGAMAGTALTALVLVELFGFGETSTIAAAINCLISAISFLLAWVYRFESKALASAPYAAPRAAESREGANQTPLRPGASRRWLEVILFTTGFTSLAMEVAWTRAFTFVLKTTIYAFATILTTYLLSTWIGSYFYRRGLKDGWLISAEDVLAALCVFALLPIVLNDPRLGQTAAVTPLSIVPFCVALGYLTPQLIDAYSRGDPADAGRSYSVNIAGGILGPLVAAYVLLPAIGTHAALVVLGIPMFLLLVWARRNVLFSLQRSPAIILPLFAVALFVSRGYEDGRFYNGPHEVRRDHAATVIAYGEGMDKRLLVNGVGMTFLTPITKVMAHLPLAINNNAKSGLIICFGMGTTFRAMHSWGIDTTVVELSRSVTESFGFFFPDFADVTGDPKAHIVVDDGRRYLLRTNRQFDVITLDPPPPIEAAASSLLYSKEFYDVVKAHLAPGGILQQWFPGGEENIQYAVARSLRESFPYVVAFKSIEDWGYHFLASPSPIRLITPAEFAARLPESAKHDLLEWNSNISLEGMAENILSRQTDIGKLLSMDGKSMVVTDDLPYNEYFALRRSGLMN
jgi:spermidine synthase